MVKGSGLVATAFMKLFGGDENIIIFASGVSNSNEIKQLAFDRERILLESVISSLEHEKLIYFSTCSINDPDLSKTPYILHKLAMEKLVQKCNSYNIFRVPQLVGKSANPHTLTNYLYTKIINGEELTIWKKAKRYLIDVEDVVLLANFFIRDEKYRNQVMNLIMVQSIFSHELVSHLEKIANKKAQYKMIDAGGDYEISLLTCHKALEALGKKIMTKDAYLESVLKKYYG